MVFSSLIFLYCFLPLNIILYYSVSSKTIRNCILVIFSLLFYAWGEPVWVALLLFSTLVDYLNGLFIERHQGKPLAWLGLLSTLVFNLGILITFKYSDFIISNLNRVFGTAFTQPHFLLPIGISFYTFQSISYCIDVYKGVVRAQKSFLNFLLFISLYHQLVAGPIVRYSHIADEISNRLFSWIDFSNGITRFCKGLFKKVCIANLLGQVAAFFLDQKLIDISTLEAWYGIFLYAMQMFFDFSGYSDMAIGLGLMFGFHYHENFNYPFISKSITEYWRRWHISLSTWLSDYVFMPIMIRMRNHPAWAIFVGLLLTFIISGIWHGAGWNFILWGLYFGIWVYLENRFFLKILKRIPKILQHFYFVIVLLPSWALFYFTDHNKLMGVLNIMFVWKNQIEKTPELFYSIKENSIIILIALALTLPIYKWFETQISNLKNGKLIGIYFNTLLNIIFLSLATILLVGSSYNPFLYFRF
jgi:alginate O-acetyltransferase complex protein AlgI